MIQQTGSVWQSLPHKITEEKILCRESTDSWQQIVQQSFQDPLELLNYLSIDIASLPNTSYLDRESAFPLLVPRPFADLMAPGDIQDPLLRQVLPLQLETSLPDGGYCLDPVLEQKHQAQQGVIQKYQGRVLLLISGHCAVNCRYCFRRHFPYGEHQLSKKQWGQVLDRIGDQPDISEVILSGGDPLSASDRFLSWLVERLKSIPSIQRLRIHTRLPVVIPQRLTQEAVSWMSASHLQTSMVLHINHPNEISPPLKERLQLLTGRGVHLFNQSVLLAGVNDDADTLVDLSVKLFAANIIPYYIHLLDKVAGAAHFAVEWERVMAIKQSLWRRLPGYLLPRIVREDAGQPGKTLI